jgi:hypothetical protein
MIGHHYNRDLCHCHYRKRILIRCFHGLRTENRGLRFCYNLIAMIDTSLVKGKIVATCKGDGPAVDVSDATSRVFLVTLEITKIIEQESLDISFYGSPDGATWGAKSLAALPQKFYCGESPLLLDLTSHPDVKFVRLHWEVARWGRGTETPMFEFDVRLKEVPANILKEATAEAKALA